MRVIIRVDASMQIGTGHVMRCLTLADALATEGAECHFVCREHSGNMIEMIRLRGYGIHALSVQPPIAPVTEGTHRLVHANWLGATWQEDARQSRKVIEHLAPDWLVVDHYALEKRWEEAVLPNRCRLLAIDDLADREHVCDLLLDQNLGRNADDYDGLVPEHCTRLIGPHYALLRPEFARLRESSLARRATPQLRQLLITMGGIDKDNATGTILSALCGCPLPEDCRITVVMGGNAPWLEQVKDQAANMLWATEMAVNVGNMAERMCNADLAIGAAGGSAWERCCLGLPSLLVVLAANQQNVADAIVAEAAAILLGRVGDAMLANKLVEQLDALCCGPTVLSDMADKAGAITQGNGVYEAVSSILTLPAAERRERHRADAR